MKTTLLVILTFLPLSLIAQDWGRIEIKNAGRDDEGVNWLALDIELEKGWKTYWQYAGQNGLDPLIRLEQDGELVATTIHWPPAHLFLADDLPSIGYKDAVSVPISFEGEGTMTLSVDIGVCETICVPYATTFDLEADDRFEFSQFLLKNAPRAELAEACDWADEALSSLALEQYWLFVDEDGWIGHAPPDGFQTGSIYRLSEEAIEPLECS